VKQEKKSKLHDGGVRCCESCYKHPQNVK